MTGWRLWGALVASGAVAALGQQFMVDARGLVIVSMIALTVGLFHMGRAPWRRALWRGWLLGLGYFAAGMHWIVEPFLVSPITVWMAPFGLFFMAAGLALFWGAGAALGARLVGRGGPVTFALGIAVMEWVRSWVLTGFPWNSPAQIWVGFAASGLLAQIGPHGLTLMTVMIAAGFAMVIRLAYVRPGPGLALGGGLFLLLWVSTIPLGPGAPPGEDRPLIRMVTPHAPQHLKWHPDHAPGFYQEMLAATAARPPADLIVWPEAADVTYYGSEMAAKGEVVRPTGSSETIRAAAGGAPVLIGTQRESAAGSWHNTALLIDPSGAIDSWHDKARLVPFGEYMPFPGFWRWTGIRGVAERTEYAFHPGPGGTTIAVPGVGMIQPLICYEGIFAQDIQRGAFRPDALVILTNDAWFGDYVGPAQHFAQARMRAIEQGLPVIRVANRGTSAMIDPTGRVTALLPVGDDHLLDARLPAQGARTLYSRLGDWPFLATIALLSVYLVFPRKTD